MEYAVITIPYKGYRKGMILEYSKGVRILGCLIEIPSDYYVIIDEEIERVLRRKAYIDIVREEKNVDEVERLMALTDEAMINKWLEVVA